MQDHNGDHFSLSDYIRNILPDKIPNGVTEGVYQALFEIADLAKLRSCPRQERYLRRTVEFLEKALGDLSCPDQPEGLEEGERPSPCACCYAGKGLPGCWDRAYNIAFERGYREAARHLPRSRNGS